MSSFQTENMVCVPFESLYPGDFREMSRKVTLEDIVNFANATGDTNPLHLDEAFAEKSRFKKRIAHGILTAGHVSALFGTTWPGPGAIYREQTIRFIRPVFIGDIVLTRATVTALVNISRIATFSCRCSVNNKTVLEGEAILQLPN